MRVEEVIAEITQRCKNYGAKRIILFGSRAKGTATERSDIDIAVAGVASCDIYELQEELEDIPTLYTIDLVDLDTCKNQLLLEDIKEYGREIYKEI
jgi:predicted nucleotidyltransferase